MRARPALIPCASRRRANQSSRPSSPRGGSNGGSPPVERSPGVLSSAIVPPNSTRAIPSRSGLRNDRELGGRGRCDRRLGRRRRALRDPRGALGRRGPRRLAVRARVADQAARRAGRDGRRRGGRRSTSTRRSPSTWPPTAPRTRRRSPPGTCSSHASGLPESALRGVAALDVAPVYPPATRRIYSNEGFHVLGALLAARPASAMPTTSTGRCSSRSGWTRSCGCPSRSTAARWRCASPACAGRASPLFNSREWRRAGDRRRRRLRDLRRLRRVRAAAAAARGAAARGRDVRRVRGGAVPRHPRRDRVVPHWSVPDWGLGCNIRDAKQPHWPGARRRAATLSHFGASGTLIWADPAAGVGLVCLANRGTYSGWMHAARAAGATCPPGAGRGGVSGLDALPALRRGARAVGARGRRRGALHCPACGLVLYDNPAPTASALVVRRAGPRAADPPRHRAVPRACGTCRAGSSSRARTPRTRSRRELPEETGLEIAHGRAARRSCPTATGEGGVATLNIFYVARVVRRRGAAGRRRLRDRLVRRPTAAAGRPDRICQRGRGACALAFRRRLSRPAVRIVNEP